MATTALKAAKRQLKNAALRYSEMEIKVREATSSDPWGPTSTLMSEIARGTHSHEEYPKIMHLLFKRLLDKTNVKHVQKALLVVEYLLRNGAERFIGDCKSRSREIQNLMSYKNYNEENQDVGGDVRIKAKAVYDLLSSDERLGEERSKADKIKDVRLMGFGSDGSAPSNYAHGHSAYSGYGYNDRPPPGLADYPPRRGSEDNVFSNEQRAEREREKQKEKERAERRARKEREAKEKEKESGSDSESGSGSDAERKQREKKEKKKKKHREGGGAGGGGGGENGHKSHSHKTATEAERSEKKKKKHKKKEKHDEEAGSHRSSSHKHKEGGGRPQSARPRDPEQTYSAASEYAAYVSATKKADAFEPDFEAMAENPAVISHTPQAAPRGGGVDFLTDAGFGGGGAGPAAKSPANNASSSGFSTSGSSEDPFGPPQPLGGGGGGSSSASATPAWDHSSSFSAAPAPSSDGWGANPFEEAKPEGAKEKPKGGDVWDMSNFLNLDDIKAPPKPQTVAARAVSPSKPSMSAMAAARPAGGGTPFLGIETTKSTISSGPGSGANFAPMYGGGSVMPTAGVAYVAAAPGYGMGGYPMGNMGGYPMGNMVMGAPAMMAVPGYAPAYGGGGGYGAAPMGGMGGMGGMAMRPAAPVSLDFTVTAARPNNPPSSSNPWP